MINFYGKDYAMTDEIICDCGCIFKKDNCDIGVSYSDKFLCEMHKPKIDIEKLKQEKIKEIKNKTSEIIQSKYSTIMQLNIDALRLNVDIGNKYTATDKTNMWNWIDGIKQQGKNFQNTVNILTTTEEIQNFNFEFTIGE